MLMNEHKTACAAFVAAELVGQARKELESNWDRASAVYEHKSLINMEARSAFRVAEFRKLVDR